MQAPAKRLRVLVAFAGFRRKAQQPGKVWKHSARIRLVIRHEA